MKPYYQDNYVTIYHGDCRELLPELPKADLVLTDPPYGVNIIKNGHIGGTNLAVVKEYGKSDWDNRRLSKADIVLLLSKGNNQIIFGGNYIADLLPATSCWLIWDKREGLPSNNFADCEMLWTSLDSPARIYSYLWQGMLQGDMKNKELRYHPTQKPVSLLKWCILQVDGVESIIDPFMGGGSTLRASKDLNRKCVGIEIEEKYCEIAAERCGQMVMDFSPNNIGEEESHPKYPTLRTHCPD